jgi:ribulose-phosphate 3-epimerase
MSRVSISLFAGDFLNMERSIEQMISGGADELHIDIMDGSFVELFGFNDLWLEAIAKRYHITYDLHFMTDLNHQLLSYYLGLPIKTIWYHVEKVLDNEENFIKILEILKSKNISKGLAISPQTDISCMEPFLTYLDEILILCCEPGTHGAQFLESSYNKVKKLKNMLDKTCYRVSIAADGGIDEMKAKRLIQNGCNKVIIGRSFYVAENKKDFINSIRSFI